MGEPNQQRVNLYISGGDTNITSKVSGNSNLPLSSAYGLYVSNASNVYFDLPSNTGSSTPALTINTGSMDDKGLDKVSRYGLVVTGQGTISYKNSNNRYEFFTKDNFTDIEHKFIDFQDLHGNAGSKISWINYGTVAWS